MLDYVVLTNRQFTEYGEILLSKMGTAEKDGRLPESQKIAYDIFIHAPLPSLVVKVSDMKSQITYKRNGEELSCKIEGKEIYNIHIIFKADTERKGIFTEWADIPYESQPIRQVLLIYVIVQSLLIEPEQYMKQSKEALPKNSNQHKSKSKKYKPPQKVTVYRLIDADEQKQKRLERTVKKREWRCLAWGVRGHYRHYKSGKVVFIQAFTKGKNKEAYKGREYVLIKKDGE